MSTRYGGLKPWPSFKHYRLEIFRIINWFDEVNIQTSALARIKLPLKTHCCPSPAHKEIQGTDEADVRFRRKLPFAGCAKNSEAGIRGLISVCWTVGQEWGARSH
jgi:hypothetical protein